MDHKQLQFKAESIDTEHGVFKGFASTSDLDQGGDIIVKGAFGRTLMERKGRVKVLWQHDMDKPIGKPTLLEEREGGLYIEAQLSMTQLGKDAAILLKDGVIDSMSIGYTVREKDYDQDGIRIIKDLDLFEVSLVSFPMNEKAVITSVKSLEVKEIERVLREAGLSRSQAKKVASSGVGSLREAEDQQSEPDYTELKAALLNLTNTLKN